MFMKYFIQKLDEIKCKRTIDINILYSYNVKYKSNIIHLFE